MWRRDSHNFAESCIHPDQTTVDIPVPDSFSRSIQNITQVLFPFLKATGILSRPQAGARQAEQQAGKDEKRSQRQSRRKHCLTSPLREDVLRGEADGKVERIVWNPPKGIQALGVVGHGGKDHFPLGLTLLNEFLDRMVNGLVEEIWNCRFAQHQAAVGPANKDHATRTHIEGFKQFGQSGQIEDGDGGAEEGPGRAANAAPQDNDRLARIAGCLDIGIDEPGIRVVAHFAEIGAIGQVGEITDRIGGIEKVADGIDEAERGNLGELCPTGRQGRGNLALKFPTNTGQKRLRSR